MKLHKSDTVLFREGALMTRTTGPAAVERRRRGLLLIAPWGVAAVLALTGAARLLLANPTVITPESSPTPAISASAASSPGQISANGASPAAADRAATTRGAVSLHPTVTAEVLRLARRVVASTVDDREGGQRWALDLAVVDTRQLSERRAVLIVHGTAIGYDGDAWDAPVPVAIAVAVTTPADQSATSRLTVGPAWPVTVPVTIDGSGGSPDVAPVTTDATLALIVDALLVAGFAPDDITSVGQLDGEIYEVALYGRGPVGAATAAAQARAWTVWLAPSPTGLRVVGTPDLERSLSTKSAPTPRPDTT
jgi:hypothetical protein